MNQDISQTLQQQILSALETGSQLQIQGGGSKHFLGHISKSTPLQVSAHQGIISYDPVELVVTARAGTRLSELENTLAEQNQMLPFEPPHFGPLATLGGTIACGLAGPSRSFSGSARDYVLGVKMINGKGEILNFGGQVMKNVAGYDCSRLMAGAMGTLGVLLEVSLKVLPKPAAEITLVQSKTPEQAIDAMNHWSGKSLPLSAGCYVNGQLYLRLNGAKTAVDGAHKVIGGELLNDSAEFWTSIKEHQHTFFQSTLPLWRLSVPAKTPVLTLSGENLIDWCGAQRWLFSDHDADHIRKDISELGGHATLFRRQSELMADTYQLPDTNIMQLHQRLKLAFDPAGIFNPGRLYPGL